MVIGISTDKLADQQKFTEKDGIPRQWISAITEDEEGLILCLSDMGGVRRYAQGQLRPYLLRDGSPYNSPFHVCSTLREGNGTLWMAT